MSDKTKLILNSFLELGFEENDGKGKGKYFRSRFIEPGVAHYNELGDILITKETLNKFINTMVGCPVIIDHKDVTDKNVDKLRVGVVSKVWFNEYDGYFYCEGILTDPEAIDLVKNQGWNVSCAYSFVSDNTKRLHNGKEIDMEFTDGEFLHLALVQDPRYEGANIVVNSKEGFKENEHPRNDFGEFVKKINSKGFDASIEDFDWGDLNNQTKEGIKDLRPYIKDDKAYIYDKDNNIAAYHEWGHLLAKRNPELYKAYENINKDFEQFVYKDVAITSIDELFAEVFARYINEEDDEEIKKLKFILEKNKKNIISNNIGDITMSVLNDLKDFIMNTVKNEKEDEMKVKNEDKRKLIDEVGGILKGKVDDEIIRTIMKKMEEASYESSEDGKADNEEDEKEAKNKCKNEKEEIEEKEEKVTKNEDEKEDKKEDENKDEKEEKAENKKVKNSMKDLVMGGDSSIEEQKLFISRKERLEEGNKY